MATISVHDAQTGRLFTAEVVATLAGGLLRVKLADDARPSSKNVMAPGRGPAFCTVTADGTVVRGSYGDSQ